tara:strand:- start:24443 stop:25933 length:1491 start_codon:yes stop_codon:yes gene_type:complete
LVFNGLISTTVFLPLVGSLIIAVLLKKNSHIFFFARLVTLLNLILSGWVLFAYKMSESSEKFKLIDRYENWIPFEFFKVEYYLGVDGFSAPLILLTGLLTAVAVFSSKNITYKVKQYFVCLLLLETAVMGVFSSLDLFLFFIFWELELIPMFFLIMVWGSGRKNYSAMKFLIFTLISGALILFGILILFATTKSFDMTMIPLLLQNKTLLIPMSFVFFIFFIAFAIKLPVWPLHTWLPDAHTDAPTAGSVMLAGVLIKMAGYGLIRICIGFFPEPVSEYSLFIVILAVINVIYGAVITMRQTDMKRLIAFSSISHMGFVLLGIAAFSGSYEDKITGLVGASLQMFTHGTITGLLFLIIGYIYEKTHTRYIPHMGGLVHQMPRLSISLTIAGIAALGLPGTSGFISEIIIFIGAFPVFNFFTAIGVFGVVLTSGYILWMIQRIMYGPQLERFKNISDASIYEMIPVVILIISILFVGLYPSFITEIFKNGIISMIGK